MALHLPAVSPKRWPVSRRKFLAGLVGLPALGLVDGVFVEPVLLKTTCIDLSSGKPAGRVAHFSDLHHKGDRSYLQKMVDGINGLAADIVCFTGDIVEEVQHLPEALEGIRAIKSPVFGVPGNHDRWAQPDFAVVASCFAATGGAWLRDESMRMGRLHIIGATCDRRRKFPHDQGAKNVLLMHYPGYIKELGPQTFDLVLAGHSHGGQVRVPFFGAPVVPFRVDGYDLGLFRTPAGPLYVSPGVGHLVRFRLNCRPEIALLHF